jgi:hypothetical protein
MTHMLQHAADNARFALASLQSARLWYEWAQDWPKGHFQRRACLYQSRLNLTRAMTHAEIARLAQISHAASFRGSHVRRPCRPAHCPPCRC